MSEPITETSRNAFQYRVLRYAPNLVRDEWVNIGILLEDGEGARRKLRMIEEPGEFARVRRLHPGADEEILRALPAALESQLAAPPAEAAGFLAGLEQALSNAIQFSPRRGVLAGDFDAELDRLYRDHVAAPRRGERGGILETTRAWIRARLNDVFRQRRILDRLERGVRAAEFTQPGDPLKLDYGYRLNGTRGFIHGVSLHRDPAQAKALAYTMERIGARAPQSEFIAVTEAEPSGENERHQFVVRLFEEQKIRIIPLAKAETWAEELQRRFA